MEAVHIAGKHAEATTAKIVPFAVHMDCLTHIVHMCMGN